MNTRLIIKILTLALSLTTLSSVQAHRVWILPSTTVLSGDDQWVSFEAAVSNNLFFPNHRPLRLESIIVKDPEGEKVELENAISGEIRSSFELNLKKEGTYLITLDTSNNRRRNAPGGGNLSGSFQEDGENKRWRGSHETLISEGMVEKPGFTLRERGGRNFATFVTSGNPSFENIKPTGKGLEIEYETHPNDLYYGETASLKLLIDGKPAANTEVVIIKGNDRFRNSADELNLTADENGIVEVNWASAGRFWLEATYTLKGTLHGAPSEKSFTYVSVLEVLPE